MQAEAHNFQETISDMFDMAVKATEQFSDIMERVVSRKTSEDDPAATVMTDFNEALLEFGEKLLENPDVVLGSQMELMQNQLKLWQQTSLKFMGQTAEAVIEPENSDRRFKDEEWSSNVLYDYLKQFYLLQSKAINDKV